LTIRRFTYLSNYGLEDGRRTSSRSAMESRGARFKSVLLLCAALGGIFLSARAANTQDTCPATRLYASVDDIQCLDSMLDTDNLAY
jgi:hypothetical protein